MEATRASADERARVWLDEALEKADSPRAFHVAWASAGRKLGRTRVASTDALPLPGWTTAQAGRAALLLTHVGTLEPDAQLALVEDLYYRGEQREREALLKTLHWLPDAGRFTPIGVEACRMHVQTVFDAIACDNPFPAAHFPNASFNQMVLKAIFTETPTRRIVGLADRVTAELVRMVESYASERRAAGRPVPDDCAEIARLLEEKLS